MRFRVVTLVLAVVAPALVVVGPAEPALALSKCPTGLIAGIVNSSGQLPCYGGDGSYRGYIDNQQSSSLIADPLEESPTQLDIPSSVVASGEPSGATADIGSGLAEEDAAVGTGEVVAAETAGAEAAQGVPGLNVAIDGYLLGSQLDNLACSGGITWFCAPSKSTGPTVVFQPNGDVGVDPQGWSPTSVVSTDAVVHITSFGLASQPAAGSTAAVTVNVNITNNKSQQVSVAFGAYSNNSAHTACGGASAGAAPLGAGQSNFSVTLPACSAANGGLGFIGMYSFSENYASAATAGQPSPDGTTRYAVWCPVGTSCRPAAPAANPLRDLVTTNNCQTVQGSGVASTTTTATSASFTETGTYPQYPQPGACPAGTTLTGTQVVEHTLDGSHPDKTLWNNPVPNAMQTWEQKYPQCETGICRLGLYKVQPNNVYQNCFTAQPTDTCNGWFQDSNKSSDYECTYGTSNTSSDAVVSLTECTVYAPAFDPAQQAKGTPLGDPNTGATGSGQPNPNPLPSGTTTGSPTGSPGAGGNPLPGQDGASCYPSGWAAFNPLEWVYKPIKCALLWAFVPSQASLQAFVTQVQTAYQQTSIATWVNALSSVGALTVPSSGCGGMTLNLPNLGPLKTAGAYDVFDTCVQPWQAVSQTVYALLMILLVWFTSVAVFRIIAASFGMDVPTRGD